MISGNGTGPMDDFVITVQTDNSGTSSDTQFTIPTRSAWTYDYNVDCDDDGTDEVTGATGDYTCDYGAGNEGTYTVRIKDNSGIRTGFPSIFFRQRWGQGQAADYRTVGVGTVVIHV